MENLSLHGCHFIASLEGLVKRPDNRSPSLQVKRVANLVYALVFQDMNVIVLYYMPGATRITGLLGYSSDMQLLHIDEDLWINKPVLLINRIKVMLGGGSRVYARQCVVARIDKNTALSFQKDHHLQVELPGKYRYGSFFQGELMAIMVFSGGRIMRHSENYRSFECLRFCSKQGYVIIGGFTKLLKSFIADFSPNDVMTYVDKDWSDGSKFEKMGFVRIYDTKPQCFWVNKQTNERISVKLYEKLDASQRNGFYKVSNCGSIKMIRY